MIDATKAVEAGLRLYEFTKPTTIRTKGGSFNEDVMLVLEFCRQVERERAAMPAKLERLRDEIALHALEGMLASHDNGGHGRLWNEDGYAEDAYAFADAMLEARREKDV